MSNIFDEAGHIATESECGARWSFGKPGEFFRCAFCGHKFVADDWWRAIYTNDMPEAGGNPLICKECASNHTTIEIREIWRQRCEEMRSERNWWFFRGRT